MPRLRSVVINEHVPLVIHRRGIVGVYLQQALEHGVSFGIPPALLQDGRFLENENGVLVEFLQGLIDDPHGRIPLVRLRVDGGQALVDVHVVRSVGSQLRLQLADGLFRSAEGDQDQPALVDQPLVVREPLQALFHHSQGPLGLIEIPEDLRLLDEDHRFRVVREFLLESLEHAHGIRELPAVHVEEAEIQDEQPAHCRVGRGRRGGLVRVPQERLEDGDGAERIPHRRR
jgi:hypothetical protein